MSFIECPICAGGKPLKSGHMRFTNEKSFRAHLGNHKKRGDVFDMDVVRSQVLNPQNDMLRDYLAKYAKVLPKISKIQPKRNDAETIMAFVSQLCTDRGIKFECPKCGTKFCPEGGKK